jgi:hypothetical protein
MKRPAYERYTNDTLVFISVYSDFMQRHENIIPPPEPLLPKTIAPSEPLRTGAQTPFL